MRTLIMNELKKKEPKFSRIRMRPFQWQKAFEMKKAVR